MTVQRMASASASVAWRSRGVLPLRWSQVLSLVALVLMLRVDPAAADRDYYAVLGVPRNADGRQVKRAYKRQALHWHPDKHQGPKKEKATAKFQEIAQAYEVLSDPEKRRLYDLGGDEAVKGQPSPPNAGAGAKGRGRRKQQRGGGSAAGAAGTGTGPGVGRRPDEIDPAVFEAFSKMFFGVGLQGSGGGGSGTGNFHFSFRGAAPGGRIGSSSGGGAKAARSARAASKQKHGAHAGSSNGRGIAQELTLSHFRHGDDPCGGQFCLLLLGRGPRNLAIDAREALSTAAARLKEEPVRSFYVRAEDHPDFAAAFSIASSGLRGRRPVLALLYRPKRGRYELFDGDVVDGAALAEFAVQAVHRGTPLPHHVLQMPKM